MPLGPPVNLLLDALNSPLKDPARTTLMADLHLLLRHGEWTAVLTL